MEILFTFWLVAAVATALVANSKGRSAIGWFFIGAIFGVFALIVVAIMEKPQSVVASRNNSYVPADTKACPYCAEVVRREAIKCKHCGSDLIAAVEVKPYTTAP